MSLLLVKLRQLNPEVTLMTPGHTPGSDTVIPAGDTMCKSQKKDHGANSKLESSQFNFKFSQNSLVGCI